MFYELKGSLTGLVDDCVNRSWRKQFDFGFGFELTVYRLHGADLRVFWGRLAGIAQTTTIPSIIDDLVRDTAVCKGVLIIETAKATLVYGSPYEFDLDRPYGSLERLGHLSEFLQESLDKFKSPLYSAAGQAHGSA